MILRVPDYFDEFECIAGRCRHSCCAGWEVEIDEKTFDYYKAVGSVRRPPAAEYVGGRRGQFHSDQQPLSVSE